MKDQLDRIEAKIDRLDSRMGNLDVTSARQAQSLEDHIRRTEILEAKIEPVEKHVAMVNGALKLIGLSCMVGGLLFGILKFILIRQ